MFFYNYICYNVGLSVSLTLCFSYVLSLYLLKVNYRYTGRIGTVEVNRDTMLELRETFCLCVSPGSSPVYQFTSIVPIHPV